ncbi:MAG: hypothetical protein ACR2MN_12760 [Acidimicrobiales bacterium]
MEDLQRSLVEFRPRSWPTPWSAPPKPTPAAPSRLTGTSERNHPDITQASLMAFAGVNCESESDELGLIMWRAIRLAGAPGRFGLLRSDHTAGRSRFGRRTDPHEAPGRRLNTALSGMATVAHASVNPRRGPGESGAARQDLAKAVGALEEASKDANRHRSIGGLIGMAD